MSDYGIAVAEDKHSMQEGDWKFDSRRKKLTVDTEADPKHLDLFELDGGEKWAMVNGDSREETLFRIEHKMPFPPKFFCFFYYRDAPSGFSSAISKYDFQVAQMVVNAFGYGEEKLIASVDEDYFYIKHVATAQTTLTTYGSDFKFRVRYELMNQKALYTGQ